MGRWYLSNGRATPWGSPFQPEQSWRPLGATITHRLLAHLFVERGVRIDRTYQLNFGGNTDFMNMLERERLAVGDRAQAAHPQVGAVGHP